MEFSLIIPCYNEEKSIRSILSKLTKDLDNRCKDCYELIVVNDGSTDSTRSEIIKSDSKVILIDHPRNLGYGAALKSGIKKAKYNLIVITDADGTYPNERIPELVSIAVKENQPMVVGSRTGKDVNIPMVRKPAKWIISKLAEYLTGTKIPDLNSGLRVMEKKVVEKFFRILPEGFSFTSTITMAMLSNGYSVKYIPIDYRKRTGISKISPIKDTINFIQLIIRTSLYFNPLKVFIPFSFLLSVLAFLVLFVSGIVFNKMMDVTFGIIMMTAIIVLAIGMLADLIDKRMP